MVVASVTASPADLELKRQVPGKIQHPKEFQGIERKIGYKFLAVPAVICGSFTTSILILNPDGNGMAECLRPIKEFQSLADYSSC